MVMIKRPFGTTPLMASALGLGCSCLGGNLERGHRKQALMTLQKSLEIGINFYDTADSYGQGQSEKLLGQAFKDRRDQVIFATKVGCCLSSGGNLAAKVKPVLKPLIRWLKPSTHSLNKIRGSLRRQNFSSDYLIQSVEGSLRRLQTDYLDLLQLHSPAPEVIQTGEVFETLAYLKQQGKLRYYGVSCETIEDAWLCIDKPGISALQIEVNLLNQRAIDKFLPAARRAGLAIIARQPFCTGRLFRAPSSLAEQAQIEHYRRLARQYGCSLAHLALRFVNQLQGVSVVIAGTNTPAHLDDNIRAFETKSLTDEQMGGLMQMPTLSESLL